MLWHLYILKYSCYSLCHIFVFFLLIFFLFYFNSYFYWTFSSIEAALDLKKKTVPPNNLRRLALN